MNYLDWKWPHQSVVSPCKGFTVVVMMMLNDGRTVGRALAEKPVKLTDKYPRFISKVCHNVLTGKRPSRHPECW